MTELTERDQELLDDIVGTAEKVAEDTDIDEFTDPKSGLHHGHHPNKHRIVDLIGRENVYDLNENPNSHEAVHEAHFRAEEFGLDDSTKEKLRRMRENDQAPIPPEAEVRLSRKYA